MLLEEVLLQVATPDQPYGKDQFADYVLLGSDGKPLAVVEAKRTSRDELAGKRQAADYAEAIKAKTGIDPFIFLTNGKEIQFWDRDRYPPRKIAGFYSRDDLERLKHQKQYALPVSEVTINTEIAGRDYQNEAIRWVTEGIDAAKRKFLLVMATGTGKTRTTIALVDTLLRAKRVQKVLFLADRRELARQAMSEFKTHLPNESLSRIEGGATSGARIQFATYPSMMQVYQRLSVGCCFTNWFHPYLRHPNGSVSLGYDWHTASITFSTFEPVDAPKAANLDRLLNLTERWTREFKAEHLKQRRKLMERERRRLEKGRARQTHDEIEDYFQTELQELSAAEPHYEVYQVLFNAILEPYRLAALKSELEAVS
nr:DEAD/DEAH box helicase family protein [Methylomonas sp. WSC-6]